MHPSLNVVGVVVLVLVGVLMTTSAHKEVMGESSIIRELSWDYYDKSCPHVQSVVRDTLKSFLDADITQAAGLLRLHFHDCFVLGCDASILLVGNASEQTAPPNLSLRAEAFNIINTIKQKVEEICPNTVSCADILALAARDSVCKARGPWYSVPLGRRDSLVYANRSVVLASLPPPSSNVSQLLTAFKAIGLNATDLVALSGGHTIGRAHCPSFAGRLDPEDPNLDPTFAETLRTLCPATNSSNFTNLDVNTPNRFDNQYYAAVVSKKGLLNSDAVLTLDSRTNGTVASFSSNQQLFFKQFGVSMIKMGSFGVLTGTQGEVRSSCAVPNPSSADVSALIASS